MEAWQLALLAWEGLKLLVGLGVLAHQSVKPADPPATPVSEPAACYRQIRPEEFIVCPDEALSFTLPEPDAHWAVRR